MSHLVWSLSFDLSDKADPTSSKVTVGKVLRAIGTYKIPPPWQGGNSGGDLKFHDLWYINTLLSRENGTGKTGDGQIILTLHIKTGDWQIYY